jgi:DNA-binding LytR/AlgR family response regulator
MIIGLCDDDETQLNYIEMLIKGWSKQRHIPCEVLRYCSAEEFLFEQGDRYPFDLIILDIQMKQMNGMELARRIRDVEKDIPIIFLTGIRDYVFEGYEVGALRYLLKPVKEEQLIVAFDEINHDLNSIKKNYYIFRHGGEMMKQDHEGIIYVEALGHYIKMITTGQAYEWKDSISQIGKALNMEDFIYTHRSYIVNLKYVEKINKTDCLLSNGITIPVSRSNYQSLNEAFIKYYRKKLV